VTDLEIDRALALAIGWNTWQMWQGSTGNLYLHVNSSWRVFSYKDWNVIGPIAERYDVFPYKLIIGKESGYWNAISRGKDTIADTPQKAIAMAVIAAGSSHAK